MIRMVRVEWGYCLECGRATLVGGFELRGWRHIFPLCSSCLHGYGKRIDDSAIGALKAIEPFAPVIFTKQFQRRMREALTEGKTIVDGIRFYATQRDPDVIEFTIDPLTIDQAQDLIDRGILEQP